VSKLSAQERAALPASAFALPGRRMYPIHDIEHARDALRMVAAHGTEEEQSQVKRAVHKKYPQILIEDERENVRKSLNTHDRPDPRNRRNKLAAPGDPLEDLES
jgi:hypothetical protein